MGYIRAPMKRDQLKATNEVIDKLGGMSKACETFGCVISNIQHWRTRGIPQKFLKRIVKLTGVTRERLRPDLYG